MPKNLILLILISFVFISANSADDMFPSLSINDQDILNPPSEDVYQRHIERGMYYFQQGLNNEAKASLWQAIGIFPDNPDAYINLAVVYTADADYEGALRILHQAQDLAPQEYYQQEILYYNLGLAYLGNGDPAEAMDYFIEAISVYPDFGESFYYLGKGYEELGQNDEAFINISIARHFFDKKSQLDYKNSAEDYLASARRDPDVDTVALAASCFKEAGFYLENDELDKAFVLLQECIFLIPQYIEAHYELAFLHSSRGEFREAVESLTKIIKLDPKAINGHLELGHVYLEAGDDLRAQAAFKKALEAEDYSSQAYYSLAMVYFDLNRFASAKENLKKARKLAIKENNFFLIEAIDYLYAERAKEEAIKSQLHTSEHRNKKKPYRNKYSFRSGSGNKGYLEH